MLYAVKATIEVEATNPMDAEDVVMNVFENALLDTYVMIEEVKEING